MAGAAAIEGRSRRTFKYRHAFNIVGINARYTVAEVVAARGSGTAEVGIVQGYTVNNIQGLIIACHFSAASQNYPGRSGGAACSLAYNQTGHTACHRVDDVGFLGFFKGIAFYFFQTIAESFPVALDTESGNHYFAEHLCALLQGDFHRSFRSLNLDRLAAYIADFQCRIRRYHQSEIAIDIGNNSISGSFLYH